jgi:hypothetical protein
MVALAKELVAGMIGTCGGRYGSPAGRRRSQMPEQHGSIIEFPRPNRIGCRMGNSPKNEAEHF